MAYQIVSKTINEVEEKTNEQVRELSCFAGHRRQRKKSQFNLCLVDIVIFQYNYYTY